MVARPAEQVLGQIAGIEHTYSVSRPGMAVLTVQFKVGVPRTEALVRLYDVLNANQDWLPQRPGRAAAHRQAQGHRRCAGAGRHAVEPRRPQRQRTAGRGPRDGSRAQARAGRARGADHRRPGPRGAGDAAARARCASAVSTCCACSRRWPRPTWACRRAASSTARGAGMLAVETGEFLRSADDVGDLVVGVSNGRAGLPARSGRRSTTAPRRPTRHVWFTPGGVGVRAPTPGRQRTGRRPPGRDADRDEEAGPERGRRRARRARARRRAAQHGDARRHRSHHHARLRRDRGREGQQADPEAGVRHRLGDPAGGPGAGPARGRDRRRGGDPDADRHPVRQLGLGLHAEPRQPVRADLLASASWSTTPSWWSRTSTATSSWSRASRCARSSRRRSTRSAARPSWPR